MNQASSEPKGPDPGTLAPRRPWSLPWVVLPWRRGQDIVFFQGKACSVLDLSRGPGDTCGAAQKEQRRDLSIAGLWLRGFVARWTAKRLA